MNQDTDEILEPGTYFVVRSSDLFASSGLWAYCHALETVLELSTQRQILSSGEVANLRAAADKAASLASEWHKTGQGRLPS